MTLCRNVVWLLLKLPQVYGYSTPRLSFPPLPPPWGSRGEGHVLLPQAVSDMAVDHAMTLYRDVVHWLLKVPQGHGHHAPPESSIKKTCVAGVAGCE